MFSILGSTRILTRAVLHYPQTWLVVQNAMERGANVGRKSEPIYMMRYEDILALTPEDARSKLGIRGTQVVDTADASMQWR